MSVYYLLAELVDSRYTASEKARRDVNTYLNQRGYRHLHFFNKGENKVLVASHILKAFLRVALQIEKGNLLVIQYPYSPKFTTALFSILKMLKKLKQFKMAILIHDIVALRTDITLISKDISKLNVSDFVVSHNDEMTKVLREHGCVSTIIPLEIFDYYVDGIPQNNPVPCIPYKIVIAGNLDEKKSGYIYKLHTIQQSNMQFLLYGPNFAEKGHSNAIVYKGKTSPEQLVDHICEANFGLVWDGAEVSGCEGPFGEYLKYNNPHKVSLYLAAGLPVIIWSKAAMAQYIERNGVGFCVDSIYDIATRLKDINSDDYLRMLQNVKNEQKKIIGGDHINTVFSEIEKLCNGE